MKEIKFEHVKKSYGDTEVVKDLNFTIKEGERLILLGPSGCGKSTILRMIAGLEDITAGNLFMNGQKVNDIPSGKRNVSMVFQNYALYPHMTVKQNIIYGLKVKKVDKEEIEKRLEFVLEMLQLKGYEDRLPKQLSGGQRQRVALARATVKRRDFFLLDEPLSNLDAKLRVQMRTTIKKVQKKLGITTIYVTHDQEEALAISDRIAVMKSGKIQQIGRPKEIYTRPSNEFVANFIGISNILQGEIKENHQGDAQILLTGGVSIHMKLKEKEQKPVKVSVRPEEFRIGDSTSPGIQGKSILKTFLGDYISYEIELMNGQSVEVNQYLKETAREYEARDTVSLYPIENKINVYDIEGKEALVDEQKTS